jgi:N-acyl-D-amino-acid deacylase
MTRRSAVLLVALMGADLARAIAGEPDPEALRTAIDRGLAIARKAADNYPKHRDCFACHHQTLPLMAAVFASEAGLDVPRDFVTAQVDFTRDSFASRQEELRRGTGIGGRAMTVGYGLLTLALGDAEPDDLTTDMVTFLLKTQEPDGHWATQARRPPMEESRITCTALSLFGIDRYASAEQREAAQAAFRRGLSWIVDAPAESTEDHAARLWSLCRFQARVEGAGERLGAARDDLVKLQRDDGGWGQRAGMASDAYATGEAVTILRRTGTPPADPVIQRGVAFLLRTQEADGSWFVRTRSKPVQVYFDNGDPHGRSQFISIPATCWAVAALASVSPQP